MNKKFGALSSSTNPEQLGNTVRAVILGLSATIIALAGYFGVPLAEGQVAVFATQTGLAVSSLWFLYGIIQKIVVRFAKR